MLDQKKTKNQLIDELVELRRRLEELKPLKIEHKRTEESLHESERKLSTLISNLPGVVYRCLNDKNWTMEYVSDGCFHLTGFKPPDLIGNRTVAFNDLIHPTDQQLVWDQIQESLKKKQPYRVVYRIRNANGEKNGSGIRGLGFLPLKAILKCWKDF